MCCSIFILYNMLQTYVASLIPSFEQTPPMELMFACLTPQSSRPSTDGNCAHSFPPPATALCLIYLYGGELLRIRVPRLTLNRRLIPGLYLLKSASCHWPVGARWGFIYLAPLGQGLVNGRLNLLATNKHQGLITIMLLLKAIIHLTVKHDG